MKSFQNRVRQWLLICFGIEIANDEQERNLRFIEESLELVQSLGMEKETILTVLDHVYDRPKGEYKQEIGGVMVTLAALCAAQGVDMNLCAEQEYDRIMIFQEDIRRKHFNKPDHIRSILTMSKKPKCDTCATSLRGLTIWRRKAWKFCSIACRDLHDERSDRPS